MHFEGIYTPVITPYTPQGAIDEQAFDKVLECLIDAGVHGIIVGGSTGEYYVQTLEERVALIARAHQVIDKRLPLVAGTGAMRTEDAVMLATEAKRLGADALLVTTPPYALPTETENAEHALKIDQAANLPIMLYNYPQRMGANMGETYLDLIGKSPNICAIKESSGDIGRLHFLTQSYPHIQLCCGMDDQALEFFVWGTRCWVCAGSNFLPKEHIAFYETCAVQGDFITGRALMQAMMPLMHTLEQGGAFIQSIKHGCELMGLTAGPPRAPLRPLDDQTKASFANIVNTLQEQFAEILGAAHA